MASITLGPTPSKLTVNLARGGSFALTITKVNAAGESVNFIGGDTVELVVGSVTWTATPSGATVAFDKTVADVTAALAGPRHASLWLVNGVVRTVWADGEVKVVG